MSKEPRLPLRVLLIEDSENDALLILRELRKGGFEPQDARVDNEEMLLTALEHEWDLIISDYNLPGFCPTRALKLIQEQNADTPVIVVSGSIGEDLAVGAMKAGAQDYIMKDSLKRLVPAIERELREAKSRREHRKAQEIIHHMAYHDALTGLVNRAEFERQLEQALTETQHSRKSHGLLYLDLDQFKIINDTCGHVAGDELLRQLAVILGEQVRESDTLARLGGDEFGVLLLHCDTQHAVSIAETLLQAINDFRFVWQEKSFAIGSSIGLVNVNANAVAVGDLLRQADLACYAAKDLGRNRVQVFDRDDQEMTQRHRDMEWATRIRHALDEGRLILYVQDILALITDSADLHHQEFLVRMLDEQGEMISPGAFIPAAERYNLMSAVDRWIVRHALLSIAQNREGSSSHGRYFINLSGASLSEPLFYSYILRQLEETNVSPELICFEITETAAISNLQRSVAFIKNIRSIGCYFALDDFGSGLSSFSYLKTIPVDYLKIDGTFVRDIVDDNMDCAIVEAINNIAHVAGLKTIAEFVENADIFRKLQQIGVDYAQGYHLGRPNPVTVKE